MSYYMYNLFMYIIKGCDNDLIPSAIKESTETVTMSYKWRCSSEGNFGQGREGTCNTVHGRPGSSGKDFV